MKETWEQFEKWLSRHWPDGLNCLNPPATDEQIAKLEEKLEVELPDDFVACLKIHNGQSGYASIFDGMEFLSCEEIYSQWLVWKNLLDRGDFDDVSSEPEPGIKSDWWNPKWIPFTHDGGGDHLCLDLDPTAVGSSGQVITMWHDMGARELKAKSFAAYFEAYVTGILAGKYVYSEACGGLVDAEHAA